MPLPAASTTTDRFCIRNLYYRAAANIRYRSFNSCIIKCDGHIKRLLGTLFFFCALSTIAKADLCYDELLLEGGENIVQAGLDSTNNWWAITMPFSNRYRLVVNGEETEGMIEVKAPVFSPDSERWAAFIRDNTGWYVIDEAHFYPIVTQRPGAIVYSRNSEHLAFSYEQNRLTNVQLPDTLVSLNDMLGTFYLADDGKDIAYLQSNGDMVSVRTLDWQSPFFQEVKLVGLWHTGEPVYSAFTGNQWELYLGDEIISEPFQRISDLKMNLAGTVLAFAGGRVSGRSIAVMYTEELNDLFRSKEYDNVSNITLHPTEALVAYKGTQMVTEYIVLNNTEYWGGEMVGTPKFSHEGSEVSFLGCNVNCFLILNGERYSFGMNMGTDFFYDSAPNTKTLAYATNAGLNVLNLESGLVSMGRMMDTAWGVRYNRFENVYQSLGTINGRLYLLSCRPSEY